MTNYVAVGAAATGCGERDEARRRARAAQARGIFLAGAFLAGYVTLAWLLNETRR